MTDNAHIPEETLALYALQALDQAESAAVRAHVAGCAECRAELARTEGDLALVAMSVTPQPVPEGARARFLNRIRATQKSEPAAVTSPVISIASKTPAKRATAWPAWLAAAAMLLVSIGLGVEVHTLSRQLDATAQQLAEQTVASRHAHEVLDLLTAPTAQHITLTTGKTPLAPSARAVYLASRGALVLEASNLKPLPAAKAYELWVIPANGAAPIPAGLFWPDAAGSASVVMPQIPAGVTAKAFGVTIENDGGSATPTMPIVLAGAAPAAGE
jgi:Anti-sigma-K factor rskA/Putative zinc-finger